jgi:serine-type D-Ala-D-Ala carboxypeptidase/endopeptidase (penicillin-binding protein 4)
VLLPRSRTEAPEAVLRTTVLTAGSVDPSGVLRADLVLRGGGDPTLTTSRLEQLAAQVRDDLRIRRVAGSVLGDETAFDLARGASRTAGAYDRDMGGVLSALAVGRGWARDGRPAAEAARRFAKALRAAGVKVEGRSGAGAAPAGAQELTSVASPTVAALARAINQPSDNFASEQLLKALHAASGATAATTAGGAAAVRRELAAIGVTARVADGSGLSRANRIAPHEVVDLVEAMAEDPRLGRPFVASLALAGRSGTLKRRMRGTAAAGRCRAKTGTIRAVSTLAGVCTTRSGRLVGFAFLMNGTSYAAARRAQDRMTAAIARVG